MSIFCNHAESIYLPIDKQITERAVSSEIYAIQDCLVDVLRAPTDKPLFKEVVAIASAAIQSYGRTLTSPSKAFLVIEENVAQLAKYLQRNASVSNKGNELELPLLRRLLPHPGYALCMSLHQAKDNHHTLALEAAGLAIAFAIATGQKVEASFSNDIRREIAPKLFYEKSNEERCYASWKSTYLKKRAIAGEIFENGSNPDPESDCERLFDVHAQFELKRKMRYSPPRQRQALLDRRHQSEAQLLHSARLLLKHAQGGDQTAILWIVAFMTGLSLATTMNMPLASAVAEDTWILMLDIEAGLLKTNIAPLTPASANPKCGAGCFRPANKVVVKPLPSAVSYLLKQHSTNHPRACSLRDLLPAANTSGRQLTLPDSDAALAPSIARMLSSAGPYSV